ncbi:hypothetical protein H0H92_007240, partial [Tricholoma furcatifolium]
MSTSVTDTPHKTAVTIGATRSKMMVSDIEKAVAKDIKDAFFVVDTKQFIDKIFPPFDSKVLTSAFKKLKTDKEAFGNGVWANFPKNEQAGKEHLLYAPFAKACNAIVRVLPNSAINTDIAYVDRHSKTPYSSDTYMVASRPDGAGATPDCKMQELEDEIRKLEEEEREEKERKGALEQSEEAQGESSKRMTRADTNKRKAQEALAEEKKEARNKEFAKKDKEMGKLRASYQLWWLRIHLVYEIKCGTSYQDWRDALEQLLAYMRAVFIEQLDR